MNTDTDLLICSFLILSLAELAIQPSLNASLTPRNPNDTSSQSGQPSSSSQTGSNTSGNEQQTQQTPTDIATQSDSNSNQSGQGAISAATSMG